MKVPNTARVVGPPNDRIGLNTPFFKHVWIKLFQRRPQKSDGEVQCCKGASEIGCVGRPVNMIVVKAKPEEHVAK